MVVVVVVFIVVSWAQVVYLKCPPFTLGSDVSNVGIIDYLHLYKRPSFVAWLTHITRKVGVVHIQKHYETLMNKL